MKKITLLVGCPGSGKTWAAEQLSDRFEHVPHDGYRNEAAYVGAIVERSGSATKPLLAEAPFSVSRIKEPLERAGFDVTPIFVIDDPAVIGDRYRAREGRELHDSHLKRQETYRARAAETGAFAGTSDEVVRRLKG